MSKFCDNIVLIIKIINTLKMKKFDLEYAIRQDAQKINVVNVKITGG